MPRRPNDLRPTKISKAERINIALRMRAEGYEFEQIGQKIGTKAKAARQLVNEGLALCREENAELAGLAREEELNKLQDLYRVERIKAETFKISQPTVSTHAVKNCIAIARRQTQLRDAEPAIKVDIPALTNAVRNRMQVIAHVLAEYIDAGTLSLILARMRALEESDSLAQIEQGIIDAESERVDEDDDIDEAESSHATR